MRLSLPPFPRVNSRRWRSQTFLTLYISRSWWDPLRTKKPSEKLLPETEKLPKKFSMSTATQYPSNILYILYGKIEKCHSLSKITTEKQPKCLNICQHHPDNLWSHISHSSRGLGSGESNLLSCRPTGSIFSDWRIGKAWQWWHTENKSFQWCLFQRKMIIN